MKEKTLFYLVIIFGVIINLFPGSIYPLYSVYGYVPPMPSASPILAATPLSTRTPSPAATPSPTRTPSPTPTPNDCAQYKSATNKYCRPEPPACKSAENGIPGTNCCCCTDNNCKSICQGNGYLNGTCNPTCGLGVQVGICCCEVSISQPCFYNTPPPGATPNTPGGGFCRTGGCKNPNFGTCKLNTNGQCWCVN